MLKACSTNVQTGRAESRESWRTSRPALRAENANVIPTNIYVRRTTTKGGFCPSDIGVVGWLLAEVMCAGRRGRVEGPETLTTTMVTVKMRAAINKRHAQGVEKPGTAVGMDVVGYVYTL